MALEIFYSALHWAKKAERFATRAANSSQIAQTAAAQASQATGKIVQLGFDGAIEDGKLVFKHAPSGVEVPYQLLDDYEYEVDMLYNSAEELSSDLPMVIKNGPDTVTFVSALHRSSTEPATVGDMKAVMRYNSDTGYRWLFKAAYKITPAGKKVFLLYPVVAAKDYSDKTNCITEIPQDIKLELNNGTLTLKAGSKVYVPNGFKADGTTPKFDVVTITSDMQISPSGYSSLKHILCVLPNNIIQLLAVDGQQYSGSTAPSGKQYMFWYDTANNYVKYTTDSGSTWQSGWCLPLAIVMVTNGTGATSIDQVFNGFGYIGSTVFALPGVKGLIPDGRNADGTLRNTEFTNSSVVVSTLASGYTGEVSARLANNYLVYGVFPYDEKTNYNYNVSVASGNERSQVNAGNITASSGKITSFNPKTTFHAVDRNDSSWLSGLGMPSDKYINLTIGATGTQFTTPANGWFNVWVQGGATSNNKYLEIINNTTGLSQGVYGTANFNYKCYLPAKKGDKVTVQYNNMESAPNRCRFIYSEGEE